MSYNPNVVDGKEWQYQDPPSECEVPCKPKEHAEHDVLCSTDHDAHYCFTCDHWVEKVCASKKCTFCKDRPEKMVKSAD